MSYRYNSIFYLVLMIGNVLYLYHKTDRLPANLICFNCSNYMHILYLYFYRLRFPFIYNCNRLRRTIRRQLYSAINIQ